MTPTALLRLWLARLAAAPRHSEVEAEAIRKVDELVEKLRKEKSCH